MDPNVFTPQTYTEHLQVANASIPAAEMQGPRDKQGPQGQAEPPGTVRPSSPEQPPPVGPAPLTCRQTVPPVPVEPGLAVAAVAGGVVSAEGVPRALPVVVLTGLLAGTIVCEDWKVKQTCIKRTKWLQHHRCCQLRRGHGICATKSV